MKKLALLGWLFLMALPPRALAALDESCRTSASKYLNRGALASPFGGDRLWAIDEIEKDTKGAAAEDCIFKIRKMAVDDAREYWAGYIAVKYNCNNEDASSLPAQRPEGCPEDKWQAIKKNLDYISRIEKRRPSEVAINEASSQPAMPKVCKASQNGIAELKAVVKQIAPKVPPPNPCAKFEIEARFRKNAPTSSKGNFDWRSCMAGGAEGGKSLGQAIKSIPDVLNSSYQKYAQFVRDPGYRASVMSAVSDFVSVVAHEPAATQQKIWDAVVMSLKESIDFKNRYLCMNADGQSAEICKQVAEKGIPALLGIGAIRKITQLLKAGKAVPAGLSDLKNASAAAETTSTAPTLAGANSASSSAANSAAANSSAANSAAASGTQVAEETRRVANPARAKAVKAQTTKKAMYQKITKAMQENGEEIRRISKRIRVDREPTLDDMRDALGLHPKASIAEVKKNIKILQQKYHTDKDPDLRELYEDTIMRANIMNDTLRTKYLRPVETAPPPSQPLALPYSKSTVPSRPE